MARWLRWLQVAIGLGLLVAGIRLGMAIIDVLMLGQKNREEQQLIALSFYVAILAGLMLGFWFVKAGHSIINALFGYRRDRMLVDCWDALHKEKLDEQKS